MGYLLSCILYSTLIIQMSSAVRFLINARYVVKERCSVILSGEDKDIDYILDPNTVLLVNRFDGDIPILRWRSDSLQKFVEIKATSELENSIVNIVT
jgi:hypothetical protein